MVIGVSVMGVRASQLPRLASVASSSSSRGNITYRGRSTRLAAGGKGFGSKPKQKVEPVEEPKSTVSETTPTTSRLEIEEPDVPEEVADRALGRMLTFSGIPFAIGLVFFPLFC